MDRNSAVSEYDEAATRKLSHQRDICCQGYERSDGLWDIEATLSDIKGFDIETPDRPLIATDERLHYMSLCLTINVDMKIIAVNTRLEATPYRRCPKVAAQYQSLCGLTIGPGWQRSIRELLGGVKGCAHLREILSQMATVAYQTIGDAVYRKQDYRENPHFFKPLINSCYGLDVEGGMPNVLWPEFFQEDQGNE